MNHWINSYLQKGLWGCLHLLSKEIDITQWSIYIEVNQVKIHLHSSGILLTSTLENITDVKIESTHSNEFNIYIPVFLYHKVVFILYIISPYTYSQKKIKEIQFLLQILVEHESLNKNLYPSIIPFLYPFSKEANINIQRLNDIILDKNNNHIFLNGQMGTGKKSFFQCYMLFKFSIFCPNIENSKSLYEYNIIEANMKVIFITELAKLSLDEQNTILENIKTNQYIYIISSIYPPDILKEKEIISVDIYNFCIKYRAIVPSLKNRDEDITNIIAYFQHNKLDENKFIWKNEYHNELENNLSGLIKRIYMPLNYDISYWKDFPYKGIKLRDLITQLEIEAIKYAKSTVNNSQYQVSKILGISRGSLQNKLKKYKIKD